jgi:arsenical pump membrane protein
VVLPPLAITLAGFGLRDILATRIAMIRSSERRLAAAYVLWLGTSAILTLDVAAAAAGSVAMAIGRDRVERRWQLGAAVLGTNIGSLLFPFSNLTNLILVSAAGMSLGTYLAGSIPAQLAAAVAAGVLLVARFVHEQDSDLDDRPTSDDPPVRFVPDSIDPARPVDRAPMLAASIAAAAAVVAIIAGFAGGSLVAPFIAASAVLVAWSIGSGRISPRAIVAAIPWKPLGIVVLAALASGPISAVAAGIPRVHSADPIGIGLIAIAGAVLAAVVNNLPAALFGAVWLAASPPAAILAWLIGTNFAALVTPHGSLATMLARSAARRHGPTPTVRDYLGAAWRYAAATSVAAIAVLTVFHP